MAVSTIENEAEASQIDRSEDRDTQERLREARRKFEAAVDHRGNFQIEAHRALRFYSNSELEGQWENDDLGYLREQGRPAFSFNIIAPKVNDFLGFYADAQRRPTIRPAGSEDELLAEVLDIAVQKTLEEAGAERILARTLQTGTVAGECGIQIEVEPHEHGHGWVKVNLFRVMPFELHWDASSIEAGHEDARCVFIDRWLKKDEFEEAYPGQEDAFNSMITASGHSAESSTTDVLWSEPAAGDEWNDDYNDLARSSLYSDRHANQVRVIHYEYKTWEDQLEATNVATGQSREIGEEELPMFQAAIQRGQPIHISSKRVERVKVMEFIGVEILAEYDRAGPFDGFSVESYAYAMDEETGTPHGIVRNLFDCQMEINKGKSQEIEHMAQSIATGSTIEEGAVADEKQFSDEGRRPGGVRVVKKDALVEGRVRDDAVTPPNVAAIQRVNSSVDLFHEISGLPSNADVTPAAQAQAATTVAIRYNKARQSVSQPFGHFEDMQKGLMAKVAQIVVRAMPDDQIAALVSSPRYQVQQGIVAEVAQVQTPQGPQMMAKRMAELRQVRSMKYNLELEFTSESSTLRNIELQTLTTLANAGVPVDPAVLIERAVASRSDQEKLKQYVEQQQQQQAQAAQQQMAMQQQQFQSLAQAEMAKSQVKAQENAADAQLELRQQNIDALLEISRLWEQADENEKARLFEFMRSARQQPGLLQ